jgi:hypothetical protein
MGIRGRYAGLSIWQARNQFPVRTKNCGEEIRDQLGERPGVNRPAERHTGRLTPTARHNLAGSLFARRWTAKSNPGKAFRLRLALNKLSQRTSHARESRRKCTRNHTQSTDIKDRGSSKTGETCRVQEVKTGFSQKYTGSFADVQIFDRLRYGSPVVRVFSGSYKRRVSPGGGVLSRGHCADAGKELRKIVF